MRPQASAGRIIRREAIVEPTSEFRPGAAHAHPAPGARARHQTAQVRVQRAGDEVTRVEVRCACGDVTVLYLEHLDGEEAR